MARLKTDAERGPLGAWAYNTRDALDLSAEAVMGMLPTKYHPATLRKIEGGTVPPGRRMWRELGNLYGRVADEKRVAIDPQPRLAAEGELVVGQPDALVTALNRQSNAIEALVELLARREGITLFDLAEVGESERIAAAAGLAGAIEAERQDRRPAPAARQSHDRTPPVPQPAKR